MRVLLIPALVSWVNTAKCVLEEQRMENKPQAELCPHPGTSSELSWIHQAGVCQSKAQPRWEWNSILANPAELNPPLLFPFPKSLQTWMH